MPKNNAKTTLKLEIRGLKCSDIAKFFRIKLFGSPKCATNVAVNSEDMSRSILIQKTLKVKAKKQFN